MGVYIKGMEMPPNCCQCAVNMEVCKRGYEYLLKHPELYDKRADDCPLVPVHTPHGTGGKLMYDELVKRLRESKNEQCYIGCFGNCGDCKIDAELEQAADAIEKLTAYVRQIEELLAPTIIPAEEGEI